MLEYTSNGIGYTWELANCDGASFILFPTDKHSKAEINFAKKELHNNQDVVRLKIADRYDRINFYKSLIFKVPETRPLKWYQIEQDDKILERQFDAGTTPKQFVEKFVLPFVKETEAKNFQKYGDKMYNY